MKTTIYYFTGTGNSLKAARDVAQGLGNTELISIGKAVKNGIDISKADRVGIVFPVYVWGAPIIVVNFIKMLQASDKYFFSVVTYGGMPGGTTNQVKNLLKTQGIQLSAGFGIKMPGNYTPLYGAKSEETCKKLFDKEKGKIENIVKFVKDGKEGVFENSFFLISWLCSGLIYNLGIANMHKADKEYWVKDNCTKCGICEKICPVKNINLVDGKPVWNHKCEQCLACLQWCPVEAIQFGKKTETKKRYRHPEVKAEDLF